MKKIIKIVTLILTAIFLFCSSAFFVGCDKKEKVEQVIEVHLSKFNGKYRTGVETFIFTKENWNQRYEVEYDGSEYFCEALARYSNGNKIYENVAITIDYINEDGFGEEKEKIQDKGFYSVNFGFFTGDFRADLRIKII